MFVQLGKTYTNGKIAKMERYSLDNFLEYLLPPVEVHSDVPKLSWYDKVFKTKKFKFANHIKCFKILSKNIEAYKALMKKHIIFLIENDNYGKGGKK